MNIANAKDLVIIHGLPPTAIKGDRVSIDSEFFGQDKSVCIVHTEDSPTSDVPMMEKLSTTLRMKMKSPSSIIV